MVASYRADPALDIGDPASEEVLLAIHQPMPHHNGGHLLFGPDGYLYISVGDGGAQGSASQNLHDLLGSILRIDVSDSGGYRIPPENPLTTSAGRPEIIAAGLRNPWRFSIDEVSNTLWLGDVGESAWEEINAFALDDGSVPNFGWVVAEGNDCSAYYSGCDLSDFTPPLYLYPHEQCAAVIGGFVYRAERIPSLNGVYLFADYCQQFIGGLAQFDQRWQLTLRLEVPIHINSFGAGAAGEVFLVTQEGSIYELISE